MPGSMLKHCPTRTGSSWVELTSPGSWSSRPIWWPRRCVKYGPKPASSIMWRAVRSICANVTPGRTMASAASFARRTVSYTSSWRAVGSAVKNVRVMSEQYASCLQPTSNSTMSPLWNTVPSGSWWGSAAFAPKLTMGEKLCPWAPSLRYSPRSPLAIWCSVTPSRTCAASQFMARSFVRLAWRISSCSRASFTERAASTAHEPSLKPLAARASISGSSQLATSFLSTPRGAAPSSSAATRGTGSSVSSNVTSFCAAPVASGNSLLQNITVRGRRSASRATSSPKNRSYGSV